MKKIFVLLISFIIVHTVKSQTSSSAIEYRDFIKVTPPAPEAAAFIREVKAPIDYSTGIPNISVPIYDLKFGNVSIPITLNYHAGGIMVNQIATSVGLGWSLSAGGAINRVFRGKPDNITGGWSLMMTESKVNDLNANIDIKSVNDGLLYGSEDYYQDDYSYNFLGNAGSFYFDENNTPHPTVKNRNLKIEVRDERSVTGEAPYFRITDDQNYEYKFSITSYTSTVTRTKDPHLDYHPYFEVGREEGYNSWKLSKIKNKGTYEECTFTYEAYDNSYDYISTDLYEKLVTQLTPCACGFVDPSLCETCGDSIPSFINAIWQSSLNHDSLISKIQTKDKEVNFYYSINPQANYYQKKLDSVVVSSRITNEPIKRIYMVYDVFTGNNQLKLSSVLQFSNTGNDKQETKFAYYEDPTYPLQPLGSKSQDLFGFYNGKPNTFMFISSDVHCTACQVYHPDRNVNPKTIAIGTLRRITYNTGGFTEFKYEPNQTAPDTYGPGIRIKEQREYAPHSLVENITEYLYEGYRGESVLFPFNILPEIRSTTYLRKIFSSNYKSSGTMAGYAFSLLPGGYAYDKVTILSKGNNYNLKTVHEFDNEFIHDGYKASPSLTSYYTFNTVTNNYQLTKSTAATYQVVKKFPGILMEVPKSTKTICHTWAPGNGSMTGVLENCISLCNTLLYSGLNENSILKIQETEKTYDNTKEITQTKSFVYDNPDNNLPTSVIVTDSKGETFSSIIKYPYEMVHSSLDPTGIYNRMQAQGLVSNPIMSETYKTSTKLSTQYAEYGDNFPLHPTTFFAVKSINMASKNNLPEARKIVHTYNGSGNCTEYSEDGLHYSFVWDYSGAYPTAKVVNASSNEIAYTSFEIPQEKGNWIINTRSVTLNNTYAYTGQKSLDFEAGVTELYKHGLPSNDYIVSYWSQNGSMLVNNLTATASVTHNGWSYYEHRVNAATAVDITSSVANRIDELRLYPAKSQMSTFSYNVAGAVISTCDEKNTAINYAYDGFNRLKMIRNCEGHILKTYEYQYSQSFNSSVYYNDDYYMTFQKNDCPAGYTGGFYHYYVPARTYASAISKNDANLMAERELNELGQIKANKAASCYPPCTIACASPANRCINGHCERGQEKYTASVYNPTTGYYECTYHYEFSDGFFSGDYYVTTATDPCIQ